MEGVASCWVAAAAGTYSQFTFPRAGSASLARWNEQVSNA